MKKLLIVYYSPTNGNTRRVAHMLQEATGADIVEIETAQPYTGSYDDIVVHGQREVNSGFMPELRPLGVSVSDYGVIAVGTPTWWYTMAPAVKSCLTANDWRGKTVIPFQTHGGWPGHAIKDVKAACPGAQFACEMKVQFDSTGGSTMVTDETKLHTWADSVKAAL